MSTPFSDWALNLSWAAAIKLQVGPLMSVMDRVFF